MKMIPINNSINEASLLEYVMDMKPLEVEIYRFLARMGPARVVEIGEYIGRDRSTTHRMLANLVRSNMVLKRTVTLERGGYFHRYRARKPIEVIGELKRRVRIWKKNLFHIIENGETAQDPLPWLCGQTELFEEVMENTKIAKTDDDGEEGQKKVDERDRKDQGTTRIDKEEGDEGRDDTTQEWRNEQIPIHLR